MKIKFLGSAVVASVVAVLTGGCLDILDSGPQYYWPLEEARKFDDYEVYWLGEEYHGIDLDYVLRIEHPDDGDSATRDDIVGISYGELICDQNSNCEPYPLDIDIQPYCEESPEMIMTKIEQGEWYPGSEYTEIEIRGVASWLFGSDAEGALYIWAGNSAIRIGITRESGLSLNQAAQDLFPIADDTIGNHQIPFPPVGVNC